MNLVTANAVTDRPPYTVAIRWKDGKAEMDSRAWSESLLWIGKLEGGEGTYGSVYRVLLSLLSDIM